MKTQTPALNTAELPAFVFPLRLVITPDGRGEIWTREHADAGSKNNFVLAECQQPEEAAFIVRACNSHAALVAALERAKMVMRGTANQMQKAKRYDTANLLDDVADEAERALSAAKP